ncbi:MAG: septum formation initiator family protein [Pyrinomonadaceae bacterium]|nr:septum formation initiator family protein [Pyrinomonadaceae bacterium]
MKEGAIYWTKKKNKVPKRGRTGKNHSAVKSTPFVFAVVILITFMLCLAINFRAFSEARKQSTEYSNLNNEIETLTTNNLDLQEEIQNLKKDDGTIAREARKIGMSRSNEKVLVPKN